ncbi:MAG: rod shape-determining protein MreC [Endomicrobia bacterium]|nr:rod shape-determining protein MreC [Endomicrobiia bacterium]MCL2507007.1 rod shape-determining protein MreC [Endomicrobiia bacterium]
MSDNRKSKLSDIVFIILLALSFALIIARSTPFVSLVKNFVFYVSYPNVSAANQIFQYAGSFAENIKSIVYISQENLSYKQKNQELTDKLRNYDAVIEQYDNLAKLLNVPKIKDTQSVFARISTREPNEWYQWFIINKGEADSLSKELPVVMLRNNGELCAVGRIIETRQGSAKVGLITNSLSAVPVEIKGKKINCLAEGLNSNMLKITYIPLNANIEAGDEVIVSPFSSVFNAGMPIGVIKSVLKDRSLDFKTAIAEVYFDSVSLYEAIVLVPKESIK